MQAENMRPIEWLYAPVLALYMRLFAPIAKGYARITVVISAVNIEMDVGK